jgi:hypothetical protein
MEVDVYSHARIISSNEAGTIICTHITPIPVQYLASSAKIVSADREISKVANIDAAVDQRKLNARKRPGQILKTQV